MAENLAILVTRRPDRQSVSEVAALVRAARAEGGRVQLFLMIDGVEWIREPQLEALAGDGVVISVCAQNAEEAGVEPVAGIDWASQYQLARIVAACDRFQAFT